jgi:hypothetical protein
MQINEILKGKTFESKKEKGSPRNARQAIVQEVLDQVNPGRLESGYKILTHAALETRYTGRLSLFDLQWHVQECKKSKHFSKAFFGGLKAKK